MWQAVGSDMDEDDPQLEALKEEAARIRQETQLLVDKIIYWANICEGRRPLLLKKP